MDEIKFAIEGTAAAEAAEDLLNIDGLSGEYALDPEVRRDGGLTVVATVVGIVGGAMAIAEQIRQWYAAYKARQTASNVKKIEKVLIVTPKGRFLLEDATISWPQSESGRSGGRDRSLSTILRNQ